MKKTLMVEQQLLKGLEKMEPIPNAMMKVATRRKKCVYENQEKSRR